MAATMFRSATACARAQNLFHPQRISVGRSSNVFCNRSAVPLHFRRTVLTSRYFCDHSSTPSTTGSATEQANKLSQEQNTHGVHEAVIEGAKAPGEKFVMMLTCTVCETRSAKAVSKKAYSDGVVLIKCPGCSNLHLIADRLGWFEDGGVDIQQILERQGKGHEFKQQTIGPEGGVLELSEEDLQALYGSKEKRK